MVLTVLYDSDCGICTATAGRLARRQTIDAVAIQSIGGADLLADVDPAERLRAFHVVTAAGVRTTGGDALATLARALPGGRVTAPLLERFPGATARSYDVVARNRHRISRLFGRKACSPHEPI